MVLVYWSEWCRCHVSLAQVSRVNGAGDSGFWRRCDFRWHTCATIARIMAFRGAGPPPKITPAPNMSTTCAIKCPTCAKGRAGGRESWECYPGKSGCYPGSFAARQRKATCATKHHHLRQGKGKWQGKGRTWVLPGRAGATRVVGSLVVGNGSRWSGMALRDTTPGSP